MLVTDGALSSGGVSDGSPTNRAAAIVTKYLVNTAATKLVEALNTMWRYFGRKLLLAFEALRVARMKRRGDITSTESSFVEFFACCCSTSLHCIGRRLAAHDGKEQNVGGIL